MTLNSSVLSSYGVVSLTGRSVDQRARQEGADAVDHDGEAALDLAGDGAGDEFAGFEGFFEFQPGRQALGLVARQDGVAVAVFERVDGDRDEVAGLDFELALVVLEFFDRDQASDLRPALTTTKLWSTRTTSAVMTSPDFISWCLNTFVNRSAKLSPPAGGRGWRHWLDIE